MTVWRYTTLVSVHCPPSTYVQNIALYISKITIDLSRNEKWRACSFIPVNSLKKLWAVRRVLSCTNRKGYECTQRRVTTYNAECYRNAPRAPGWYSNLGDINAIPYLESACWWTAAYRIKHKITRRVGLVCFFLLNKHNSASAWFDWRQPAIPVKYLAAVL